MIAQPRVQVRQRKPPIMGVKPFVRSARVAQPGYPGMPCTPRTSRCANARDVGSELNACCREHIRTVVRAVRDVFAELDIPWWLDYGSVLGVMQNPRYGLVPGIVPTDKDADAGFLAVYKVRVVQAVRRLRGMGFDVLVRPNKPYRFGSGDSIKVRLSATNHTNIDLFPWYDIGGGFLDRRNYIGVDRDKGREFPKGRLFPIRMTEWEGMQMPVPADPEWFVGHRYGFPPGNPYGMPAESPHWQTRLHARTGSVPRDDYHVRYASVLR